jgi:antitoxin component YwqK of YwqJK toxin-antitoxin module
LACRCSHLGVLSQRDIDKTDYIALVKIKDILPATVESPRYYDSKSYFKIVVEEIKHYKGSHLSEIIVAGGHEKFGTSTSCDLGMMEGSEWIIFAQNDKDRPIVYPCWRTTYYKNADGLRDWQFGRGFQELAFLDTFFKLKKEESLITNGTNKIFFPNGKLEKVEYFRQGKLDGLVEYYYPSGVMFGRIGYKNGVLHGKSLWYYPDGSLQNEEKFLKGIKIDTAIYYTFSAAGNVPHMVSIFNKKGERLRFQEYGGNYQERFLSFEIVYEPENKKETRIYYHSNRQVSSISHEIKGIRHGEAIEYDEKGKIKRIIKYDVEGKVIK